MKNFALKSPAMGKLLKYGKGNGWFLALEGGMALFTQIIPSFSQLGTGSGIKQIFKSTVKTAASVGGWIVGSAVAGQAGAMAGAAIGSIVPGVGTVIGGVVGGLIGMIGGCIGAWAATKVATKIVGKDELELAKEKEAKRLAKEASKSPEQMQAMLTTAAQRLQSEGESEDSKMVFGSLQNLSNIAQSKGYKSQTAVQDNTSFSGTNNPYSPDQIKKAFGEQNYGDADFMAMSAGLI
jgi:phage tail tape-measure protein